MNFDANVSGLFLSSASNVYIVEDMPSNLNQVQGQNFEIIIDYLKVMSVAPHSSNKLRSLNYNKIKVQYVSFLPITFNNDIIFEFSPIHIPTSHFGQMQGMNHKCNGHAWCKVKTSNIKNSFSVGLRSTMCLGHSRCNNNS